LIETPDFRDVESFEDSHQFVSWPEMPKRPE